MKLHGFVAASAERSGILIKRDTFNDTADFTSVSANFSNFNSISVARGRHSSPSAGSGNASELKCLMEFEELHN